MPYIASKKNDVIILGAFGCGAFRNNPYIVSEAMMNVIKHYRYVFKKIVFAIPSNDKSDSNYAIFKKAVLSHFIETQKNEKTIQWKKKLINIEVSNLLIF